MKKIFSGSTNFSLNCIVSIKTLKFQYIFTTSDYFSNFNCIKFFSIKKKICHFQFKNNYYYNNLLKYNIYYFIKIKESKIDITITSDYGFKFSLAFIKYVESLNINIHNSIVPLFRGGDPIKNALKFKNNTFGISAFNMNKFFDLGKINFIIKLISVKKNIMFIKIYILFILKLFIFFYNFKNIKKNYVFNQHIINIDYKIKKIK